MIQINDYIDNDPNRIVKSNLRFSSVTAYVVPRSLLSRAKDIEGIENPGVYFLVEREHLEPYLKCPSLRHI